MESRSEIGPQSPLLSVAARGDVDTQRPWAAALAAVEQQTKVGVPGGHWFPPVRFASEHATVAEQGSRFNVLGVAVDAVNMQHALDQIQIIIESRKGYVCVAGVHGVMEAFRSPSLSRVYAASDLTVPDGMPLVWVGWLTRNRVVDRVAGPDLMLEVFAGQDFAGRTHFLYGGKSGVAEDLKANLLARFPAARIVGTGAPPFRELTDQEGDEFVSHINKLRPDIIWLGISCPKQELFIAKYLPRLETRLMIGVGAAFDYHTGRIRDPARWVKRAGLQWLHRLLQDPRRLWKRYLWSNSAFMVLMTLQLMGLSIRRIQPRTPSRAANRGLHKAPSCGADEA